jgi:hypothetical protein
MNYNAPHAFVTISYVPKLGEFGVLLNLFYIFFSFLLMHFSNLYMFFMNQAGSWSDLKDDAGNTLHIGKLEYKTKHGKKPDSFRARVFPRDV